MNTSGDRRETDPESTVPAAIVHLLAEHAVGRQQFAELRTAIAAAVADETALATAVARIGVVLDYLTGALERHIAKEEGPLFPRLKASLPVDDRLIDEMIAEHDLIRIKRDALQSIIDVLDGGHQTLRAEFQTLRAAVARAQSRAGGRGKWLTELAAAVHSVVEKAEVHFENEEELVFPLAAQLLDTATLDRIEVEMQALDTAGAGPSDAGA
jgi:iron-sulfur cluster repair protein YtfE (RIC family)